MNVSWIGSWYLSCIHHLHPWQNQLLSQQHTQGWKDNKNQISMDFIKVITSIVQIYQRYCKKIFHMHFLTSLLYRWKRQSVLIFCYKRSSWMPIDNQAHQMGHWQGQGCSYICDTQTTPPPHQRQSTMKVAVVANAHHPLQTRKHPLLLAPN